MWTKHWIFISMITNLCSLSENSISSAVVMCEEEIVQADPDFKIYLRGLKEDSLDYIN